MSFRRDRETELAWRRWVKAHESELIAIGIPREVWADRMTWWRFLWHSYHPPASNTRDVRFRLDDLSPEQQLQFYSFLESILSERERSGNDVWNTLQRRFRTKVADNSERPTTL
jgi:hypothetical protein